MLPHYTENSKRNLEDDSTTKFIGTTVITACHFIQVFHIHSACCNEGIVLFTCCLHLDMFPLFSHTCACQAVSPSEGRVRSDWAITGRHQEYKQAQTTSREESASNKPPSTRKQSTWQPIPKSNLPPYLSHPVSC